MSKENKYLDFGTYLKKIRLGANKTLAEVGAAVELSNKQLSDLEAGNMRPSQELVLILSSYFGLSRVNTRKLLDFAGYYSRPLSSAPKRMSSAMRSKLRLPRPDTSQQFLFAIAENASDQRILYTNEINVNVSKTGVIFEFLQRSSNRNEERDNIVSRIGMSVEYAYQLQKTLGLALDDLRTQLDKDSRKDKPNS